MKPFLCRGICPFTDPPSVSTPTPVPTTVIFNNTADEEATEKFTSHSLYMFVLILMTGLVILVSAIVVLKHKERRLREMKEILQ